MSPGRPSAGAARRGPRRGRQRLPLARAAQPYSHYGSRGICMMTILQSWSQGVEVWGRDGMRKLWSAANVKVYGRRRLRGRVPVRALAADRRLRPQHDVDVPWPRSAARPTARCAASASWTSPICRRCPRGAPSSSPRARQRRSCARCRGWPAPHAAAVRASIAKHDPAAEVTIAEAMDSLTDVEAQERAVPA